MIQGLRAPGFRLEKLAVWGFAGSLALGAGLAHHATQAAIFADDEARKAILDLRIRFEESRNQLQEQTKQIQNLSAQIQKLVVAKAKELGVTVNPRYGKWDPTVADVVASDAAGTAVTPTK
ncbi:MAG: hypothetical protein EBX70_06795 [Betaproteobacteria bacterium]|nr:hypothetical protein [Betaproteobacteria bacterium]